MNSAVDLRSVVLQPGGANATAHHPWGEGEWKQLLSYIEARRVIPMLGPGSLLAEDEAHNNRTVLTSCYLAARLAEKLGISLPPEMKEDSPAAPTLADLVCLAKLQGIDISEFYTLLPEILIQSPLRPHIAIRELASITDFPLFVTASFDSLLTDALGEVYGAKDASGNITRARVDTRAYCYRHFKDLPAVLQPGAPPADPPAPPLVYHLLGKLSYEAEFALSEEHLLEWIYHLQFEEYRPQKLFAALQSHHLLMIGGGFNDWLARFFLRTAKGKPLSESRLVREFVVDATASNDQQLVKFLRYFSTPTRLFPLSPPRVADGLANPPAVAGTPGEHVINFVRELVERWNQRRKLLSTPAIDGPPPAPGVIFLSYAHEDTDAAKRLRTVFAAAGLNVWLDSGELKGGDEWRRKIEQAIKTCALFLPLISKNTEKRLEGFFRYEWKLAVARADFMDDNQVFIVPMAIHTVPAATAKVPDEFRTRQWVNLSDEADAAPGLSDYATRVEEFIKRLRVLLGLPPG